MKKPVFLWCAKLVSGRYWPKQLGITKLVLLSNYISDENERMYAFNGVASFFRSLETSCYASLFYKDYVTPLVDVGRDVYKALAYFSKKNENTNLNDKDITFTFVEYTNKYYIVNGFVARDCKEHTIARVYIDGSMEIIAEPSPSSLRVVKEFLRKTNDDVKVEDCSTGDWIIKIAGSWSVYKKGIKTAPRDGRISFVNTLRCEYVMYEANGRTYMLPVPIPI